MTKTYGTIKRGRVKIKSKKQLRYLEAHNLPYTVYKRKGKKRKENYQKTDECKMNDFQILKSMKKLFNYFFGHHHKYEAVEWDAGKDGSDWIPLNSYDAKYRYKFRCKTCGHEHIETHIAFI